MKKQILLILLAVVIIVLCIGGYFSYQRFYNQAQKDKESGRGVITTQKKIDLAIGDSTINVNDFISYPVRHIDDVYYIVDNLDYNIVFNQRENKFYIPISKNPVKQTSIEAEKNFLELLGITTDQACTLPIVVNGHYSVDDQFINDAEYQLSFVKEII